VFPGDLATVVSESSSQDKRWLVACSQDNEETMKPKTRRQVTINRTFRHRWELRVGKVVYCTTLKAFVTIVELGVYGALVDNKALNTTTMRREWQYRRLAYETLVPDNSPEWTLGNG
jgi:hypothetical protein